jgi:hypothetical protein
MLSLVAVLAFTGSAAGARLTGLMVFSCDSRGNPAGDFIWDTRGLDSDFYKLWLSDDEGNWLNGPGWETAPIDVSLGAGEHSFTIHFENNGPWHSFAVNLFLDGEALPSICAKVPLQTNDAVPKFSSERARVTYTQTSYPAPNGPASGRLWAHLDERIRLTEWSVLSPALSGADQVDTHRVAPSGRMDYVAKLRLRVGKNHHSNKEQSPFIKSIR